VKLQYLNVKIVDEKVEEDIFVKNIKTIRKNIKLEIKNNTYLIINI
jgi:hypothetical protein